jgi:hypothetical protein
MAQRDPVAVYNAANNVQAQLVRNALIQSGVEAYVTEDVSPGGIWWGGLISEIHKPQVWVERADIERAKPVLDAFESRAAELRDAGAEVDAAGTPIATVCEECGGQASFPVAQRGSVQQCPHCGAYLDVGGEEMSDEWREAEPGD